MYLIQTKNKARCIQFRYSNAYVKVALRREHINIALFQI